MGPAVKSVDILVTAHHFYQPEGTVSGFPLGSISMNRFLLIAFFLGFAFAAHSEVLDQKIAEISAVKEGLIPLQTGDEAPLLIVHGVDFADYPGEWIAPFNELIQQKTHSYLHKWSTRKGLIENRDLLLKSIRTLLKKFPQERLTIFGYSAGGAISLLALDALLGTPAMDRVYLHTVASPFFGFEAPKRAYVAAPIVGKGRIELGIGAYSFMKNKNFSNCHHWVTTNCALDKNSCDQRTINPQTGALDGSQDMPCGNSEMTKIDDETHTSVILPVLKGLTK